MSRRTVAVVAVVALLVAGAIAGAVVLATGGGSGAAASEGRVVGGNPAVGRAFVAFARETDVSCIASGVKNVSDSRPIYLCTGARHGAAIPCRPMVWNGAKIYQVDFWSNPFDDGNGHVTC